MLKKRDILIALAIFFVPSLLAQVPNGTYVPITDMAKQLQFAKFVFSGSKVKIYLGMNGISLGVANEYSYSLNGNTLSIKEGTTSVEYLTYDKTKDQIIYNMDASYSILGELASAIGNANNKKVDSKEISTALKQLGMENPVWGKEGTAYKPPSKTENVKFNETEVISSISNDDNEILGSHFLSLCANRAYSNYPSINGWRVTYKPLYKDVNLYCVVFENEENVVFAFRGTPPPSFSSTKDWIQTLSYYNGDNENSKHAQFNSLKELVKNYIIGYIKENRKNVYITGHSLGGWLALMAYLELNSNPEYSTYSNQMSAKIKRVVTFNSIGISNSDTKLINQYDMMNPDIIRNYYACCDIARWASNDLGFSYPGTSIELILKHNESNENGEHAIPFTLEVVVNDIVSKLNADQNSDKYSEKEKSDILYRYGLALSILEIRINAHSQYDLWGNSMNDESSIYNNYPKGMDNN